MTIQTSAAVLAGVVSLSVAIAFVFRRPRKPLYLYFAAFAFYFFIWHATALISSAVDDHSLSRQWVTTLMPPVLLFFFRAFVHLENRAVQVAATATPVISVLWLLALATPLGQMPWALWLTRAYALSAILCIAHALWQKSRAAGSRREKQRLIFLLGVGLSSGALGVLAYVEPTPGLAALGHVAVVLYLYLLYQSIVSGRFLAVAEVLGKVAVVATLSLVLATVYALLVLWVGAEEPGLWLFNTLLASFVILIIYDQVRPWVERTTARLLFGRRQPLRQVAPELVDALRTTVDPQVMTDVVLDTLVEGGGAIQAALYTRTDFGPHFSLAGHRGHRPADTLESASPVLLQRIEESQTPLRADVIAHERQAFLVNTSTDEHSLEQMREIEMLDALQASLRELRADVIVPMRVPFPGGGSYDGPVGLLVLGNNPASGGYDDDEVSILMAVAEACAVVLQNSEEHRQLAQRQRLAAIGEMATGMAHEIRNPLGAIKGAVQCLDLNALPADAREFLGVIDEEVDRLNVVVTQFLEYARPYQGTPQACYATHVIDKTVKLLGQGSWGTLPENVRLRLDLDPSLPPMWIDPEHLKQVLLNLILNAAQAMPDGGNLTVTSHLTHRYGGEHTLITRSAPSSGHRDDRPHSIMVEIQVIDTGVGICAENLKRIFLPFFTTKSKGTGLGLAISERIIESAQGSMDVRSRPGSGTTFILRIPCATASSG